MAKDVESQSPEKGVSVRVRTAISFLERSYSDPRLRLKTVAQAVRLSPHYLSYLIKKETGQGFRQHLGHIRLREAERLLLTSFRSVKEIAMAVGYDSTSSFDREFRRVHKCSPIEWRKQIQTI